MRSCILHGPTAPPARTAEHTRALQCLPGRRPGRRPCGCGGAACLQSTGRHAGGGCWPRARHVAGMGQAAARRTATVARQAAQGRPRRAGRQRRTRGRGGGPTCSAASTRSRKPSTASSCTLPGAMECGHCHLRVRSARSRNVSRSNATRPPALCARRRHRVGYNILQYRVMEPTLWSMVHYPKAVHHFLPLAHDSAARLGEPRTRQRCWPLDGSAPALRRASAHEGQGGPANGMQRIATAARSTPLPSLW